MAGLRALAPGAYHWQSGSNAGILVQDGQALIIDAGLDRSAAADIAQAVGKLGARPTALLITHAHADHFGGASFLARRAGDIPVLASPFEATIVRHPLWEPLYLYSGAAPIEELQHKFTLAKPCPVAQEVAPGTLELGPFRLEVIPLYGHAVEQVGVVWGDVCYTADAFFPPDLVQKHGIPFCVDLDAALESLARLESAAWRWFAPGHGPAVQSPQEAIAANRERLLRIRELCLEALREPAEPAHILQYAAGKLGLQITQPVSYLLAQTTVLAALTSCQRAGLAAVEVVDNRLVWHRE
ncbi:MAG: MBL fold metallo-hydrolase [Anaerolineae bacterium]